ncbi:YjbE family integral membrane protein [Anaerospora hongkongensis]|uniref:YjbE family integral membrane protein n=1 Tax=Anaerospora hongkongensis TaxID=244830 RepID=A0A4R1PWX4_9FIRM|nr:TerC family protein [Anaerospora hongkongensis]TCL36966.1 YjbE family integral membrane protein [Anaerospora hongkongensis]
MEFLSNEFLWALISIVFIDLVLAGDNAIVIGMAARNLPAEQQRKAIVWGTAGAIAIRLLSTLVVVWLLKIPALMVAGGVLLLWIALKLLIEKKNHEVGASDNLFSAVKTIVIADGVMGIDNVIGVAGLAHGDMTLIIIGVLITIPIVIWGSTAFISLIERYPVIVYLGGAILAWTAGGMIAGDIIFADYLAGIPYASYLLSSTAVIGVMFIAWKYRNGMDRQALS